MWFVTVTSCVPCSVMTSWIISWFFTVISKEIQIRISVLFGHYVPYVVSQQSFLIRSEQSNVVCESFPFHRGGDLRYQKYKAVWDSVKNTFVLPNVPIPWCHTLLLLLTDPPPENFKRIPKIPRTLWGHGRGGGQPVASAASSAHACAPSTDAWRAKLETIFAYERRLLGASSQRR